MLRKLISAAFMGGMFALITVSASTAATKTIAKPMFNGNRLDWCTRWSEDCGRPAADAYCRAQGFLRSTNFAPEKHIGWRSPTRLIGTGATCDLNHCDGFRFITCLKRPAMAQGMSVRKNYYGLRSPSNVRSVPRMRLASNGPLTIIPPIPSPKPVLREARTRQSAIRTLRPDGRLSDVASPTTQARVITAPVPQPKPVATAKAETSTEPEQPAAPDMAAIPEPAAKPEATKDIASIAPAAAEPETATAAPAASDGPASSAAPNVFERPMYNGRRLAWCEQFDASCGRPAADAFCKTKGFQRATDFVQDAHIGDVSPTRSIGSGAVCDQVPCDGFKLIACAS
jgi:hypothetical protein